MIVLDLRWVGFVLLLFGVALVVGMGLRRRRPFFLPEEGRALLEHAPLGWLMLDGPRAYRYANPCARRLLGLDAPAGRLPDAPWVALLGEDRAAATGRAFPSRVVRLAGEQAVRWWVAPWRGGDLALLIDATAQHRAEQAAAYLFGAVSHELRTPLGVILTHLEILLLPDVSEEIRRQSARLLRAEVQRMSRLVNQMLELGRLETAAEPDLRPLDILSLVEQAIAQSAAQAEERAIAVSLRAETPLPLVLGEEDRLRQVFLNLLDNAVKYCRRGDRVTISLQRSEAGVICAVCDSGPGIPAEHLPHVTRRFYRAAPQKIEGSGLGLAIVEEILRRHHSRLELESCTEGTETGLCARFVLPIFSEEEA